MPERRTDRAVAEEVTQWVKLAIPANARRERILIGLLVTSVVTGIGLCIRGFAVQHGELSAPGGLLMLLIYFPVQKISTLRKGNLLLQIIPQLTRLATAKDAKAPVAKLVDRLIQQG